MIRWGLGWRLVDGSWVFSRVRDVAFDVRDSFSHRRFAQHYRMVRPYTLCGNARLRGLYQAIQDVVDRKIPGDVVECGTARGGSAALMGLVLKDLAPQRTLWIFDTFEGLPQPTEADPDWTATRYTGKCRADVQEVSALFDRLGASPNYRLVKGLFQQTLPTCEVGPIALLHLDCDWYESMKTCLEQLFDRVSPGGIIQIDDYGHWAGARKAVDEFFRNRSMGIQLRWIDYTGRQLVKPGEMRSPDMEQ